MNKKIVFLVRRLLEFPKKKPIQSVMAGILVLGAILIAIFANGDGQYDYIVAQRRDVVQEVRVTGNVEAAEDVDLSFEEAGTISQVLASVGQEVRVGQTLVTLKNADEVAALNQAEAQADVEEAALNTLIANSGQDLISSYGNVLNTIDNALSKSVDAIRLKPASIFSGSKYTSFYVTISTCSSVGSKTENLKLEAETELDIWQRELKKLYESDQTNDALDSALADAKARLELMRETVNAINSTLSLGCALDDSDLDTIRNDMAAAQTNISMVIEDVNDLIQAIALNKISAAGENDIAAQEARVRAAEANADRYRAELEKTIIRSPINGVVTKQDARIGEVVTANIPLVSVISPSSFEVQVNIPEVEIAEVEIGRTANVSLDAYGDDQVFNAHVVSIDLAETIVGGVPNYKATLIFDDKDERIRSGMTASVRIVGETKHSVIAVPVGSVFENSEGKKVMVIKGTGRNTELLEVTVETGITGSDGFIEIITGLNEGDLVEIPGEK